MVRGFRFFSRRSAALEDSRHAHGQTMRGFTAAEMERLLAKVD